MIESGQNYHLVYTGLSFAKNEVFLRKLRENNSVEIPFLDYGSASEELREALDTYIYISDDGGFQNKFNRMSRSHPQVAFTHLGKIPGGDVLKLIAKCETEVSDAVRVGARYRVTAGPWRNLQVLIESRDDEAGTAVGTYPLLDEIHRTVVPLAALEPVTKSFDPWSGFTNLLDVEMQKGNRSAVVIDGSFALHRAMFGHDRLYTKGGRFVGGCNGFYFELLRLKELYPEREIHVVFDGYDAQKFSDNPEYKTNRRSSSSKFRTGYSDNLDWCCRLTRALGFGLYLLDDREGDDVVGSLVSRLTDGFDYRSVYIFSTDTDFYQLVSDRVTQLVPKQTFRGHGQEITPDRAREKFGVNRNDKINWFRAMAGDSSDNIPSVNKFFQETFNQITRFQGKDYLEHLNEAETFAQAKANLCRDDLFRKFVESGKYDRNHALLTINRGIFDDSDLSEHRGTFDEELCMGLLEEVGFYKEMEMASRTFRILRGIW